MEGYGMNDFDNNSGLLKAESHAHWINANKTAAAIQTERPTPMMDVAMQGLARSIGRLESLVTQAETRFSAVVAPEPPSPAREANGVSTGRSSAASLGIAIEGGARQIEGIADRLQAMIRRCEL